MNTQKILKRDAQALIDIIDAGGIEAARAEIEQTLAMLYKAALNADILFDSINSRIRVCYEKRAFFVWCSFGSAAEPGWIELKNEWYPNK